MCRYDKYTCYSVHDIMLVCKFFGVENVYMVCVCVCVYVCVFVGSCLATKVFFIGNLPATGKRWVIIIL